MPIVNQYQGIQFAGFPGGLNNHADSSRLEAEELSEALNVRLGPRGEVQVRSGYTRQDSNVDVGQVRSVFAWRGGNAQDYIILTDHLNTIYHDWWDHGHFTQGPSMSSGYNQSTWGNGGAGALGKFYLSSKIDGVKSFVPESTWTDVPTIPAVKHLLYRHNRMFAINSTSNPSRIYYSDLGDVESFPAENWIDVDPDDGFEINAAVVFGDDIILFKDHSIWKLSGRTPSSFSLYRIDNKRGTVGNSLVAQLRGRLFFYDRSTGVWAFDGANFELVSEPINDYMRAGQYYADGYKAASYVGEDRFYMSIPWGDGTTYRSFVFFSDAGGWTEYDGGFAAGVESHNIRFLGMFFVAGLYRADPTSTNQPGVGDPIVAKWRTGWQLLGGPGVKARLRRIEMTIKANVGSTGEIRMYRDYDGITPYITRTFDGGATLYAVVDADERRVSLDGWGNRVHAVMFEFETSDLPFQVNEFSMFYTGGVDVRGER